MGIARRVLEVLRAEGLRGLWWRGLAATVYRRLTLVARRLEPPPAPADAAVAIEVLDVDSAGEYQLLRPDTPGAEVERRLRAGQTCVLVRRDGAPVSTRWFATGRAEVPYLDLAFELREGVAYVYDVFTAAEARGLGVTAAARPHYEGMLRDEGCHTLLGTVLPENGAGRGLVGGAGYVPVGTIGCVRLGSLRLAVGRARPGYVGRGRRFRI
jgi:hypothetical protein